MNPNRLLLGSVVIQSGKNTWVQSVVRLHQSSARREKRRFLVEGENLVSEALRCRWPLESLAITERWLESCPRWFSDADVAIPCHLVSEQVMRQLATTESPDGVIAVAIIDEPEMKKCESLGLALDGLQDPGNLGTLLRSSVACHADCIALGSGSVDPYNPKVLRSTAGQWFRMPPQPVSLSSWIQSNLDAGVQVLAAAAGNKSFWEWDLKRPTVFVLGNEGSGVSKEILDLCDGIISIPMAAGVESLNVAMTGTLLMYETIRQRSIK